MVDHYFSFVCARTYGGERAFAVSRRFFARTGRFGSHYHALAPIKAVKAQFENNVSPDVEGW